MQIYAYNADDFDSLRAALREKRIIAAMAVFFQVGAADRCLNAVRAMRGLLCLSASSCCFRGDVFQTDGDLCLATSAWFVLQGGRGGAGAAEAPR